MFPAILHTLAFIICLCVQSMGSPLASAWLFFHLAGCAVLLYNGKYPRCGPIAWWATLAWLIMLGASAFFFASVPGAASVMFVLATMPSLALCLREEHIKPYCQCFGGVIGVYALGLILQMLLHVTYDNYNLGEMYAWPLLDPNNAAGVVNLAFIPCMYFMLFKDIRWAAACALFAIAIYATRSKAGAVEAGLSLVTFTGLRFGAETVLLWLIGTISTATLTFFYRPELIVRAAQSFESRFPIWKASWRLLWVRPWFGIGLGEFGIYYNQVRTEDYTGGWFAHNDLLQIAIEMGIPGAMIFCWLIVSISMAACKGNIVSSVTMLAIFLGSMVEFQFYVPAISLPMGLALAYNTIRSLKPDPFR